VDGDKKPYSEKSDRTNVLYTIPTLNIGGTQIKLIRMVKALNKEIFNPIICCYRSSGTLYDRLELKGCNIHVLNRKNKFDIRIVTDLLKIIRKEKIDITHNLIGGNIWGRIAGILGGVKVIIGTEESLRYWQRWYDLVIARVLSLFTDVLICNSEATKRVAVQKTGISSEKFEVVYNSVDTVSMEKISGDRVKILNSLELPEECFLVVCLSRFDPRKGHPQLIRAIRYIKDRRPEETIRLLLLGEGQTYKSLFSLVEDQDLREEVRFHGFREDALEILSVSDCLVLPSLEEGFGNTLIEAMVLSIPVIGTRVGGIPEIVEDEVNGLLVEPGNSEEIGDAIIKIMRDGSLSKTLVSGGRETVKSRFSDDIVFRQYEELYLNLLEAKRMLP
jgi:glycosyltransferase involved in cell wall biosynthesis